MPTRQPEAINTEHHKEVYAALGYGPGTIAGGRFAYVSGQIGINSDKSVLEGAEEQIRKAFENLTAVMKDLPGQPVARDVVDMTTFNTNMPEHFELVGKVKKEFFGDWEPAWTALGVAALASPSLVFEVRVIVLISEGAR